MSRVRVRVKICGVRTKEAALKAAEAGADFVGLIFAKSKRQVTTEHAAEIVMALDRWAGPASVGDSTRGITRPPHLPSDMTLVDWFQAWTEALASAPKGRPLVVGVFSNQSVAEINEAVTKASLDVVQLHGEEPLDYARQITVPVIRAIHVGEGDTAHTIHAQIVAGHYSFILLDTKVSGVAQQGGLGVSFDWTVARSLVDERIPFLVAGGLTPENVSDAVEKIEPWCVDVSSGVETDGTKDLAKVESFVTNANRRRDEVVYEMRRE